MKHLYFGILFVITAVMHGQQTDYNTKKGYVAEGYDVVAYFQGKAVEGDGKYSTAYDGVKYKFSNQENLTMFLNNPGEYSPQYGGYCAYAIGVNGEKVDIDPETYEIRDGKLYLFYNSWGINTLKKWKKEGAPQLAKKADANWQKIRTKK